MGYTVSMGYDELLAIGDMDKFLTKAKEMCEMKIKTSNFFGMEKEDVVQEVLLTVFKSINSYDNSKAKACTFFENVINNKIKDCVRKTGTKSNLMVTTAIELVPEFDADDKPADSAYLGVLSAADSGYACSEYEIDFMENIGLNDREKQIFKLRCSGYEFVEIASILGLTKARISQLWKGVVQKYEDA
jgi:RNA polymerase sporulation-specific sigma factor